MSDKPPTVPKHFVHTLLYDASLSKLSNRELFDECMKELYGDTKYDKQGCLIHELMERLEQNFEPETH